MPISRPFIIATEGRTVDGRNLPREWLTDAAAHYDPAVYTAVLNLDHYLAFDPESTFSAHGKVLSLSTQTSKILGEDRLQLTAVVEASEEAARLQASGKKCFASIEITPNFADSGKTYLTGLALTDMPAALGTQAIKFATFTAAAGAEGWPMAQETEMRFADGADAPLPAAPMGGLIEKALALFAAPAKTPEPMSAPAPSEQTLLEKAEELSAAATLLHQEAQALKSGFAQLKGGFDALTGLVEKIDATGSQRPLAVGGNPTARTDC